MKSINEIEIEIVEEFGMFENWIDKYDYLIVGSRESINVVG